jgi:rare lipoprotein A (peptidoglycan hydrolase)
MHEVIGMKRLFTIGLLGFAVLLPGFAQTAVVTEGLGSWYGDENSSGLYASHATYPFGTQLKVTNLHNNTQITVQIGGRIPRDSRWIIDVSMDGARALGMNEVGFTPVRIEEIPRENRPRSLRTTASGIRKFFQTGYSELWTDAPNSLQVGHPSLAMGTRLRLTNRSNGKQVAVTVATRVRASQSRIVSVSRTAADQLGIRFDRSGLSPVQVTLESVN